MITGGSPGKGPQINYYSFDMDSLYAQQTLLDRLSSAGVRSSQEVFQHVARLSEDNTALGSANVFDPTNSHFDIEDFRFPREISMLRNAQIDSQGTDSPSVAAPSPYLRLSGKDESKQDELPQFSRENTPLAQEAALMTLARQLRHDQVRYLLISTPSSSLDQIFLARFLRRSSPDTRLVFLDSDLLMVREVDSAPFLGSITVSPFPMTEIDNRAYSDTEGVAYYNAASMTFWDKAEVPNIRKALDFGYDDPLSAGKEFHPSLWATVIGADGYYPLAQLRPCATENPNILPAINEDGVFSLEPCSRVKDDLHHRLAFPYPVSRLWTGIAILIGLMCCMHTVMIWKARYWSTLTGNLALDENDALSPRAVYLMIGASILFLMAFVTSSPALALHFISNTSWPGFLAALVLLTVALFTYGFTIRKTFPVVWQQKSFSLRCLLKTPLKDPAAALYTLILVECLTISVVWSLLCWSNTPLQSPSYRGLGFSYRSIHPESGVSPLVPVLLLLLSWHLWSFLQTVRLRFSKLSWPGIPGRLNNLGDLFFVSSESLSENKSDGRRSLCANITDTFVAERLFLRGNEEANSWVKVSAFGLTVGFPMLFAFLALFTAVDHWLWDTGAYLPNPYEIVVGLLFYPLLLMAVMGWSRVLLVWLSLRRDLLDRLENLPIRYAFDRIKGMGWMVLMQQGAVYQHWRLMARSLESIRQILHHEEMQSKRPTLAVSLGATHAEITDIQEQLLERVTRGESGTKDTSPELMIKLESKFAEFGQKLLTGLLIPYWTEERVGLVESDLHRAMPVRARRSEAGVPEQAAMEVFAEPELEKELIVAGEEYIALRYIALIRAVLTNVRHVMAFVSAFFVLAVIAWNSYPFQPREMVDWLITGLLIVLSAGMIWVFAQMHRNPILSRTTDTKSNELGWDFYFRIISFGAVPLLTWLAYSFPQVGGAIYRFLQPGVSVLK